MFKEIKYLIFILVISFFIFFTIKYYISDENIKNSFRANKNIDIKIKNYSKELPILEDDTKDIIEYINKSNKKKKKKFNFWKLLENNEK